MTISRISNWVGFSAAAFLAAGCSSSRGTSQTVSVPNPTSAVVGATTPGGGGGAITPQPGNGASPTPSPTATSTPAPATPVVCNPFGNAGGGLEANHGLVGQLWYAPGYYGDFSHVEDFEDLGIKVSTPLYFDQLNVPTRLFKEGFQASDGSLITTAKGDSVIDYFALRFDSVIQLSPNEKPGWYQFAILSDDGSVVRIGDSDDSRLLINNDGHHASRLGCADRGVWFNGDTRRPIRIDYFQGERYHMALVLLWRRLPEFDSCPYDPACGREGNDEFFDANYAPSKPEPTWIHMLARGWSVVGADNFVLPGEAATNPCPNPAPSPAPSVTPAPSS